MILKQAGQHVNLMTYWRAGDKAVTPLQMFVHVLDANGNVVAQADRLDASPFGWQAGDVIAQVHQLDVPVSAAQCGDRALQSRFG